MEMQTSKVEGLIDSGVSSWDGTLTKVNFVVAGRSFKKKWKKYKPEYPPWSWSWFPSQNQHQAHEEGYLSLEKICLTICKENDTQGELTGCSNIAQLVDDATLVQRHQHQAHYFDFHILYSASYRVPVLYFRAYCSDGQALMLNEIERELPACSAKMLTDAKWTFITHEEHPLLQRPWYKVHPCGTSEWIKLLFTSHMLNSEVHVIHSYIISWMSVVGQFFGLQIPFEMLN